MFFCSGEFVIGKKLKDAMLNEGLSQEDFAKLLNVDRSLISRWINGERKPSAKNLKNISKILKLPVSFFLDKNFSIKESPSEKEEDIKTKIDLLNKRIEKTEKENISLRKDLTSLKKEFEDWKIRNDC